MFAFTVFPCNSPQVFLLWAYLSMFIAVETSDIVRSTSLPETRFNEVIDALERELKLHAKAYGAHYDMFRGDAFQVAYTNAEHALRGALLTKLKLLYIFENTPIAITQSLAFGYQDKLEDAFSQSMGEVFVASGRMLDTAKSGGMVFSVLNNTQLQQALKLIALFLEQHMTGLTQKQAEVLYYYLKDDYPEQHVIADKLGITRQNVAAHLKRGGAILFKQSIEYFDNLCKEATK